MEGGGEEKGLCSDFEKITKIIYNNILTNNTKHIYTVINTIINDLNNYKTMNYKI